MQSCEFKVVMLVKLDLTNIMTFIIVMTMSVACEHEAENLSS